MNLFDRTYIVADSSKNRSTDSYFLFDRSSYRTNENQSELIRSTSVSSKSVETMSGLNETEIYEIHQDDSTPDAFPVGTSQTYIGLVSGSLTIIVLFLTCTTFLIKQRGRNKVALLQKHTALLCDSSTPGIAIVPNIKDVKFSNSLVNGLSLVRKPITIVASNDSRDRLNGQTNPRTVTNNFDHHPRSIVYETSCYKLFSEENLVLPDSSSSALTTESCPGKLHYFLNKKFTHILCSLSLYLF